MFRGIGSLYNFSDLKKDSNISVGRIIIYRKDFNKLYMICEDTLIYPNNIAVVSNGYKNDIKVYPRYPNRYQIFNFKTEELLKFKKLSDVPKKDQYTFKNLERNNFV